MNDTSTTPMSALPPMIDTHCHLDDRQFASDLDEVVQNSRRANVTRWILIGYDPARWDSAIALASEHEGMFHTVVTTCASMGGHGTKLQETAGILGG